MGRLPRKTNHDKRRADPHGRQQERRRKKKNLSDLTDVAGGIVHDFNNILSSIMGHAELAMLELPDPHPAHLHLNMVLASGCRAAELVRELFTCTCDEIPSFPILQPAPKPCAFPQGRGESILLVDGEVSLARMWRALLCNLGYHVTLCHDGQEALRLCQENTPPFLLVIADGALPHLTGWELASKLDELAPGIPLILTMGGEPAPTPKPGNVRRSLYKPIALPEMLSAIRQVLDLSR